MIDNENKFIKKKKRYFKMKNRSIADKTARHRGCSLDTSQVCSQNKYNTTESCKDPTEKEQEDKKEFHKIPNNSMK